MSEMLDTSFARTFWEFVRAGRYKVAESTDGMKAKFSFLTRVLEVTATSLKHTL